ncbi:MAG: YraN family protein [Candidatus Liptonbacteria bacterium]|nr:YraN family protein [Candidatus Liptonbacteria bacterium]
MRNTSKTGRLGENLACGYLVSKRYKILYRNYKEKWDEIDIVASSIDLRLIFVEVKALTLAVDSNHNNLGLVPEDHLTASKLKRLRRACQVFANKHPRLVSDEKGWQIDLLAIGIWNTHCLKGPLIRHYENI